MDRSCKSAPSWHGKTIQKDVKVEVVATLSNVGPPQISKVIGLLVQKYTRETIPSFTTSSNSRGRSTTLREEFLTEVLLLIDIIASEATLD